jgi:hypothetical protein
MVLRHCKRTLVVSIPFAAATAWARRSRSAGASGQCRHAQFPKCLLLTAFSYCHTDASAKVLLVHAVSCNPLPCAAVGAGRTCPLI